MQPTEGTDWQARPYFRRAIETPGNVQITRPYLSVTGPKLCVTLSFACEASDGSQQVLCVDLDFAELAGQDVESGSLHPCDAPCMIRCTPVRQIGSPLHTSMS